MGFISLVTTVTLYCSVSMATQLEVMTYNVLNLFDTEHDEGHLDYQYLPVGHPAKEDGCKSLESGQGSCLNFDWTEEKLDFKLKQIRKVVRSKGPLPDILIVQEVENINVLKKLADTLGYQNSLLVEGYNTRGIDVGVMFNESQIEYMAHYGKFRTTKSGQRPTGRAILGVYFKFKNPALSGKTLAVYGNHWPARMAPAYTRFLAAQVLQSMIEQDTKRYGKDNLYVVVAGDFNSTTEDWPAPFRSLLQNKDWDLHLNDVRQLASEVRNSQSKEPTYFYPNRMEWQNLDRILVSKNLLDQKDLEVLPKTFEVGKMDFNTTNYSYKSKNRAFYGSVVTGVPKTHHSGDTDPVNAGYSDHFPVRVKLSWNREKN